MDDDSPDQTWRIAADRVAEFPALRVVRRQNEHGLATAVIRGWQLARGTILGAINADFQHPPAILADMVAAIADADLVIATRYADGGGVDHWPLHRQYASHIARFAGSLLLPELFTRVTDPLSGCYLFRRHAIAGVELKPLGFKTLVEILVRGRVSRIRECPYTMGRREGGQSKVGALHWLAS